ncbi:MAG: hypothetical protein IT374_05700 [Polyangiaceae bacterium]|nr:hypothetical protein [Polyangiaceae bacterium]
MDRADRLTKGQGRSIADPSKKGRRLQIPDAEIERVRAELDPLVADEQQRTLERELVSLAGELARGDVVSSAARFQQFHALLQASSAQVRALSEQRVRALGSRALEAVVRLARERNWYHRALEVLSALAPFVDSAAAERARVALRADGGRYHAELAARQQAAGRTALGRLHAGLARALGAVVDTAAADAALRAAFPRPALRVRADATGCSWAVPTTTAPPAGASVVEVEVRFTRCDADERRWTTTEPYTVKRYEQRTVRVPHQELAGAVTCGALERFSCTPQPGSWVTRYETETKTEEVVDTYQRKVEHRELHAAAGADVTIRSEGRTFGAPWSSSSPLLKEEQETLGPSPRRFSTNTLDQLRQAVRDSLGARLDDAVAHDTSRRLADEAAVRAAAEPDAAEELCARAVYLAGAGVDPRALRPFTGRGLSTADIVSAFGPVVR